MLMDVIINSKIVIILAINNNTLNMCVQLNHYRPTLWHLRWCWKNTSESESKFYFVEDCCWGGIFSSNLSDIQSPPRADPKSMQDSARRVFRGMAWKREFALSESWLVLKVGNNCYQARTGHTSVGMHYLGAWGSGLIWDSRWHVSLVRQTWWWWFAANEFP